MFKKMLVLMCEECFRRFSCVACIDCYKGSSEFRPKRVLPPEQGNLPIKEYFKLIETYILASDVPIDSKKAREIFLIGLNDDTKKELPPFYAVRLLTDLVDYLSEVEVFKRSILESTEGQSCKGTLHN